MKKREIPLGKKLIFRPWVRDKNGKIRFAAQYGKRVFAILVDDDEGK